MKGISVGLVGKTPSLALFSVGWVPPIPLPLPPVYGWVIGTTTIGLARVNE